MGALQLRTESNGGAKTDNGGLGVLCACFSDRLVDALQVAEKYKMR